MKIQKVRDVKTPSRGTSRSAGIDFFVPNDIEDIILKPLHDVLIPTGIRAKIPTGFALVAKNKSGVSVNQKLVKGAELVDEDYTGEIHIHVFNASSYVQTIKAGQKLMQFVLLPVFYDDIEVVDDLNHETERGSGGFGSTGLH